MSKYAFNYSRYNKNYITNSNKMYRYIYPVNRLFINSNKNLLLTRKLKTVLVDEEIDAVYKNDIYKLLNIFDTVAYAIPELSNYSDIYKVYQKLEIEPQHSVFVSNYNSSLILSRNTKIYATVGISKNNIKYCDLLLSDLIN